jgi:hypothetical protein
MEANQLPGELAPLVKAWDDDCWAQQARVNREKGYPAPWWCNAMRARGALQAALNLLREGERAGQPQQGYLHMLEIGEVKASVEYGVCREEWAPIWAYFPAEVRWARKVLRLSGIDPPS